MSTLSLVEEAKRQAARRAVDDYVRSGMVVGVGSGSTIVYAVERLVERMRADSLVITAVPTSFQAMQLLRDGGVPISDLASHPELDVTIDGADEVDRALNAIKGGGGCHTQEKLVAAAARIFVIIADYRKRSDALGTGWRKGIPLEVLPAGYRPVMRAITAAGGVPTLRMAIAKAGPVVTDNGMFIVDADFGVVPPAEVAALHGRLKAMVGVVETGLFPGMAERAYFGMEDGTVEVWERPREAAAAATAAVATAAPLR